MCDRLQHPSWTGREREEHAPRTPRELKGPRLVEHAVRQWVRAAKTEKRPRCVGWGCEDTQRVTARTLSGRCAFEHDAAGDRGALAGDDAHAGDVAARHNDGHRCELAAGCAWTGHRSHVDRELAGSDAADRERTVRSHGARTITKAAGPLAGHHH